LAGIIDLNTRERVQHFHHSPQVHLTLPHADAQLPQIGFDEIEMARAPDLKIEQVRVRPGCGPQNLPLNSNLSHDLACLREVALHLRPKRSYLVHVIRFFAIVPGFREAPGRMVQDQAAEGKQPQEEKQKQSRVEMQLAIPALQSGSYPSGARRFAGGFSG